MNKLKKGFLLLVTIVYGSTLFAQSIEDGKKMFFYERYQSAKTIFSQLVAANATNADAIYWLGQSEIQLEDIAGAKALYQNALLANANSALLLAGMGHIELLEGKAQDARQRFETAISISDSKNIAVLNAVGFANISADKGDPNYAIDKLKQATTVKKFNDPDVYINLGDAYRKLVDGGSAQSAYQSALTLNPAYARASFKIGRIYESQGAMQEEIFMKYYNAAIAADATYGPVYYDLYGYFYKRDVNKSKEYLDKYIANSDPDAKDCYYVASILYASSAFQQSIDKANDCITAGGTNVYPNLYGLKAYSYDKLGDSVNAKLYFEQYLAKQKPEKIGPTDYSTYAKNLLKFPSNDSIAGVYVDKAVALDSVESDKTVDANVMINYYTANKNYTQVGNWYSKIIAVKKQPTITDYQTAGFNYYRAGNFQMAANTFDSGVQKFPTDVYSYYMMGRSLYGIDTAMAQGLANPAFQKVTELGAADSVKYKAQLIGSYKYFIGYYINIKQDKATALMYCDKVLALDPTDQSIIATKEQISKMKSPGASSGNTKKGTSH